MTFTAPPLRLLFRNTLRQGRHKWLARALSTSCVVGLLAQLLHGQSSDTVTFASDRSGRFQVWQAPAQPQAVATQITTAGAAAQESRQPDWSRTGWIAYHFGAAGVRGIHIIRTDGSRDTRLTFDTGDERDPSWSPDGQYVVYASRPQGATHYDLRIHKVGDPNTLSDDQDYPLLSLSPSNEIRPAWSPDGRSIAFVGFGGAFGVDTEIVVQGIEVTDQVRLVPGTFRVLTNSPSADSDPAWSPDSQHLVFSSTRTNGGDIYKMRAAIPESDPAAMLAQLTSSPEADANPSWSPDNGRVAFVRAFGGRSQIHTIDPLLPEGANNPAPVRISDGTANDEDPAWEPVGCGRPTLVPSSRSGSAVGQNWDMTYEITDNDGLELRDVRLGSRYMATRMNVPYFRLETAPVDGGSVLFPLSQRCELTPDNSSPSASCTTRLVDFELLEPESAADENPLAITATYEVDNIPASASSCVLVTQRYEFHKERDPRIDRTVACEPGEDLPCARFKPIVEYQFISGTGTDQLSRIQVPQRLHFSPSRNSSSNTSGASALFRDCEAGDPNLLDDVRQGITCGLRNVPVYFFNALVNVHDDLSTPIIDEGNPLQGEVFHSPIQDGRASLLVDNYHQTYEAFVVEPGTQVTLSPFSIDAFHAGCEMCVHIHWRWSNIFQPTQVFPFVPYGPQFGAGRALIPPGSNQSLDIAVVRYRAGEEDPENFRALVGNESLIGLPRVFWYGSEGFQQQDRFFTHGGFFHSEVVPPNAHLSVSNSGSPDRVVVGGTLTYTMSVANRGPSAAVDVVLLDSVPHGVSLVSASSSQGTCTGINAITCNLGDLDPFATAVVTVVVSPNAAGVVTNTAVVSSSTADPYPDDNTAVATTTIDARGCDVNSDGTPNVVDVQLLVNEVLGVRPATSDINGDGLVNVVDLQRVVNAALGLGCNTQ